MAPDQAASEFRRSISELNVVVEELMGSRRRGRLIIALLVVALAGGGVFVTYQAHILDDQQVENCRDGNDRFTQMFDFLAARVTSDTGRELVEGMRATAVIDCDSDGVFDDDLTITQSGD